MRGRRSWSWFLVCGDPRSGMSSNGRIPVLTSVGDALERLVFAGWYRWVVRGLLVLVGLLAVVHLVRFAGWGPTLGAGTVGFLDLLTSLAVTAFLLAAAIQLVVFARGVERRRDQVAESAAVIEQTAEEVEATVKEVERSAEEVERSAADVEATASTVEESASDVERSAEEVEHSASEVEQTASEVDPDTADDVKAKAGDAKAKADNAKQTADKVKETTEDVKHTADDVKQTADHVKETADHAKETVDHAKETADTVKKELKPDAEDEPAPERAAESETNADDDATDER